MSKRILVIDGSRTIRLLLSAYFGLDGHQTITCATSKEALHILSGLPDRPDLLFITIDYEKKAYRVIDSVKERGTRCVAMVLEQEKKSIELSLGPDILYLVKPFLIQEVLALVSVPLEHV